MSFDKEPEIMDYADLNDCDKEPIHIPYAIQPYGYLLSVDITSGKVLRISENVTELVKFERHLILGANIGDLFTTTNLRRVIHPLTINQNNLRRTRHEKIWVNHPKEGPQYYDCMIHQVQTECILEIVPEKLPNMPVGYTNNDVTSLANRICVDTDNAAELIKGIPALIAKITGFRRVMVYKFDEDYNGSVIAETTSESMTSYLGLHFPSSDIPKQALALYKTNTIRVIPDIRYVPCKILSVEKELSEFDMSYSTLRSVSPIHLEYMSNMEVESSMSLSLVYKGKLWGLIACHHDEPHYIPLSVWSGLETAAEIIASNIGMREHMEKMVEINSIKTHATASANLFSEVGASLNIEDAVNKSIKMIQEFCEADGVAVKLNQPGQSEPFWCMHGSTPEQDQILQIIESCKPHLQDHFFKTDNLSNHFEWAKAISAVASGVMILKITDKFEGYLVWFRENSDKFIYWAGDPYKAVTEDESGARISPRKSFMAWKEVVEHASRPWSDELDPIVKDFGERISNVFEINRFAHEIARITDEQQKQKQLLIQNTKMAEMGGMIRAITHQWTQPLSVLSLANQLILEWIDTDSLTMKELENLEKSCSIQIDYMKQTMKDFSEFFRPDKRQSCFDLSESVTGVHRIIQPSLKQHLITTDIALDTLDYPFVTGNSNEFKQVMMILFSNARDAISENQIKEGHISINTFEDEKTVTLTMQDNAKGIPDSIISDIFNPYVSTKGDKGTGIGLYIAKTIIEDHMQGSISVENRENGACFILILKKNFS